MNTQADNIIPKQGLRRRSAGADKNLVAHHSRCRQQSPTCPATTPYQRAHPFLCIKHDRSAAEPLATNELLSQNPIT